MSESTKPRVRVQAGSDRQLPVAGYSFVGDSFQNAAANLGYGTNNLSSGSTYGFNPLTRNRYLLELLYRGSWLVRKVVDCPADDMTREGITIESDMPPDQMDEFSQYWTDLQLWQRINSALKWARLYGGAMVVMMIEGQDPSTPLKLETIRKDQFKGLLVLDRWMVWPKDKLVNELGPDFGTPQEYEVVADARNIPRMTVHHSRVIRFDGAELPYWQAMSENYWSLSVIEPLWDRLIAFDSATQGAAQLIYKAHLRVLKLPKYRELVASGGNLFQAVMRQIQMIRMMQTNEGLTVIDAEDDFASQTYTFAGLSDMMVQFAQQVSGAADIPMTRMYGQSPIGMNSTGESDLRNYYDGIKSLQEFRLRRPVTKLLDITHRSKYGTPLPKGFNYSFTPLWQLTAEAKSQIVTAHANAAESLLAAQIFTPLIALKEMRQSSRTTGFGSNITDEDIKSAAEAPPPPPPGAEPGMPGQADIPGQEPGQPPPPGQPAPAQLPAPPKQLAAPDGAAASAPAHPVNKFAKLVAKAQTWAQGKANGKSNGHINGTGDPSGEEDTDDSADVTHGAHIHVARGLRTKVHLPHGTHVNIGDRLSIVDIAGMQVVVETAKGERRIGYGWSVSMPCHYGYISGTNSSEGPTEQFDAFVGPNLESTKVWVVEQQHPDTKQYDEGKALLGFDTKEEALEAYKSAFSDGRGGDRISNVRGMDVDTFKTWLNKWKYGEDPLKPSEANGAGT